VPRSTLWHALDRARWVHRLIALLPIRPAAALLLRALRAGGTLPGSGIRYRVRDLASLAARDEIFLREVYAPAFARPVRTFVDLGCNVGYCTAYAAHRAGRDLQGLAIDANPRMAEAARRLAADNGLSGVRILHGLAGAGTDTAFHLAPSHLGSSRFPPPDAARRGWETVSVPPIDVGQAWREWAGDRQIDLLKIDIEGAEGAFLAAEGAFLRQAGAVVLEWHKALVPEADLLGPLRAAGFAAPEVLLDEGPTAILLFRRP